MTIITPTSISSIEAFGSLHIGSEFGYISIAQHLPVVRIEQDISTVDVVYKVKNVVRNENTYSSVSVGYSVVTVVRKKEIAGGSQ